MFTLSGNGRRKGTREDLRFSVVTESVPLRQMPDTVNGLSRLEIVSRAMAVISHLQHAVMLDPVEAFFSLSPPRYAKKIIRGCSAGGCRNT